MVKISATLAAQLTKKDHKYGAQHTKCLYNHEHDSRKEADWCLKLMELQKEGKIGSLEIQPKFSLMINKVLIADHYPDFTYYAWQTVKDDNGVIVYNGPRRFVVEVKGDWKGSRLPVWRLKHKLFCALYPEIEYQIV